MALLDDGAHDGLDLRDVAVRAWHTFYQSFVAALGVVWAASGIDVSQIVDVSSAKKVALSAVTAVVAAAASALKTTVLGFARTAGLPRDDSDMGYGYLAPLDTADGDYRPEHAAA